MKTGSSDSKASIFNPCAPLPKSSVIDNFQKQFIVYPHKEYCTVIKKWYYRIMIRYINRDTRYLIFEKETGCNIEHIL